MITTRLTETLQSITAPFAGTWAHIQGPGGNTSVKENDRMLIKASGYTFQNVVDGEGMVLVDNPYIVQQLSVNDNEHVFESSPAKIIDSIPVGLRPSMEFEFHSVLKTCVIHTHSVYVNIITCSSSCETILSDIFHDIPYAVIPYMMPGHPLSVCVHKVLKQGTQAKIFFLKNHGVIIHGDTAAEALQTYRTVHERIMVHFDLGQKNNEDARSGNQASIAFKDISGESVPVTVEDIINRTLVPDQSIFFRNKVSDIDVEAPVYLDHGRQVVHIKGTGKFIDAAGSMLKMVYYILNRHFDLSLSTVFIPQDEVDLLHNLSSEKYRSSIL